MKCEICHVREAGCVLHRKDKDGGMEELYVCAECRDEHNKKQGGNHRDDGLDSVQAGNPGDSPADALAKFERAAGQAIQTIFEELLKVPGLGNPDAPFDAPDPEKLADQEFEFGTPDPREPSCDFCGMTRTAMRQEQRLGCTACYEVFSHEVSMMIRDMHKGTQHVEEE